MARLLNKDPDAYDRERERFLNELRRFHDNKGWVFKDLQALKAARKAMIWCRAKVVVLFRAAVRPSSANSATYRWAASCGYFFPSTFGTPRTWPLDADGSSGPAWPLALADFTLGMARCPLFMRFRLTPRWAPKWPPFINAFYMEIVKTDISRVYLPLLEFLFELEKFPRCFSIV